MSVFLTVVGLICYNDVWLENKRFSTFHPEEDWWNLKTLDDNGHTSLLQNDPGGGGVGGLRSFHEDLEVYVKHLSMFFSQKVKEKK